MSPTERLRQEHQLELVTLQAAQRELWHIVSTAMVRADLIERLMSFFRDFTDPCHHAKEEELLIGALKRSGVPSHAGPIAWVTEEHMEQRRLVNAICAALPGAKRGNRTAVDLVRGRLAEFIYIRRSHMKREDDFLFTMVDRLLPSDDLDLLTIAFGEFEARLGRDSTHENYHEFALDFARRQKRISAEPGGNQLPI